MQFRYHCPGCRTTNNLHGQDCRFAGRPHHEIEKAYTDLVAALAERPRTETALREAVHGNWGELHVRTLRALQADHRVRERDGRLELPPPAERREQLRVPDRDPLATVYRKGSVPGCHDNAVFALVAYYEMVGFTWPETKELVVDWLESSGAWSRGGFEEATPEELVENKRHVYETGYGWKEKARAAKAVIDRSV